MMKFESGCNYYIAKNANTDIEHIEVVAIRSIEKERDGKKYVNIAKGRFYVSMTSTMLGLYLNDNDDWHSYIDSLDPSRDKKYMVPFGERGVHHLMIRILFEFKGKYTEIR